MERDDWRDTADLAPFVPYVRGLGRAALVSLGVVNVLNLYAIVAGPRKNERYWFLLVEETNPSTWLSVTLLSWTSLLAGVCFVVDRLAHRPFWGLVMASLLAMSLDDAAIIHERVGGNVATLVGDANTLSWLWVVPWAAIAMLVSAVLWRMRPQLPTATAWRLVTGAAMTIGSAVVLEVLPIVTVNWIDSDAANLLLRSVEENLEMIGVLVVAHTLAAHALQVTREGAHPVAEKS